MLLAVLCAAAAVSPPAAAQNAPPSQPATQPESQPATQPATQPESQPATQPASQPATAPVNPLRSPATMYKYFLDAVAEGRVSDAMQCLDFGSVDPEVARDSGPQFVEDLAVVLEKLKAEGLFDPSKLPDAPDAPVENLGKDPVIVILERGEIQRDERTVRVWRFNASTVGAAAELRKRASDLRTVTQQPVVQPPVVAPPPRNEADPLRSPYHMVQFFLVKAGEASKDPAHYKEAMRCLDLSKIDPAKVETVGPQSVDSLAQVLDYLRTAKGFDREKDLPREAPEDPKPISVGSGTTLLQIVQQSDGRWRFNSDTVAALPAMVAAIKAPPAPTGDPSAPPAPEAAKPAVVRDDLSSPQATMNRFLTAMAEDNLRRAVSCLDLSDLSETEQEVSQVLAGKLLLIMNREKVIVVSEIPNREDGGPYQFLNQTNGRIEIAKKRSGPRQGEWLFTSATVASIERLYDATESKPILPELTGRRISFVALPGLYVREYLVPNELKIRIGPLELWQWLGLVVAIAVALLVRVLIGQTLPAVLGKLLTTHGAAIMPRVIRKQVRPTAVLLMLATWWWAIGYLDLSASVMAWIWWVLKLLLAVVGAIAFYYLVGLVMVYATARAAQTKARLDEVLIPLVEKTLKVLIVVGGALFALSAVGIAITPLLAGLGLGGLAFGLAAQDTLKNFFGSINVVLDRPFQVGDYIKIGDVEGSVESVGLRSSKIRTFYDSQVIVPNADLVNAKIDNLGRRRYRRSQMAISVTYDTKPEAMEAFCEGVRELIRRHPLTRKDYYFCNVHAFAASSIDIMLYVFFDADDLGTELQERHRLLVDIMRLAERLGVEFAFPTQTVHLHHESSPAEMPPPRPEAPPAEPSEAMQLGRDHADAIIRKYHKQESADLPPATF